MVARFASVAELESAVGREVLVTGWLRVSQELITLFGEATDDLNWIHLDVERARRESPYGETIAHGWLTTMLCLRAIMDGVDVAGQGLNAEAGLDRLRFMAPVRAGARVRIRLELAALRPSASGREAVWKATAEVEASGKPACVAEIVTALPSR